MRIGINYDTGVFPGSRQSRAVFKPGTGRVRYEGDCTRTPLRRGTVTGGDLERLTLAANFAVKAGLDVWFSPFPCELDEDGMLAFVEDSADRAEALRRRFMNDVVLVTGCEVSVFGAGSCRERTRMHE